ncbi:MAG: YceH family protein [Candidatus Thiodiazotropha sp. (ex Semelilucina semeliformis)]|nr:YceH family protein [Candidatus Thiodiazotropha sp. (ex Myrtea spinifera)]MCU7808287.1 YceH family protein [Candidatus Thiodiazotropha sp. (ex Semelilucina semeliformis)]MCU7827552.1 YceH family protein [Candidatus Thiodiazotropha sp. (ex Myrtea sp. 'scaly one' KF741663)]
MRIELTSPEARVIGSLLEKEIITPEQYPLSLNALTAACNQKSSRDPVMSLSEREVQVVIDGLVKKHLVSDHTGFGSRVAKYQHRFCNTGFGGFDFSPQEAGVICVLLLRGAQTPGELRNRTQRLCHFADVQETEMSLQSLMERSDGPFVTQLPREAGKRESRYRHLFGIETEPVTAGETVTPALTVGELEHMVMGMRAELDNLKEKVAQLEIERDR